MRVPPESRELEQNYGGAAALPPNKIQGTWGTTRGTVGVRLGYTWGTVGPAPINLEKRPQADISVSRPVSTQFYFYPLRIIPQGTQSEGLRMRSDFGGVENSMFLAQYEIYKSGGASGKSHQVLL